ELVLLVGDDVGVGDAVRPVAPRLVIAGEGGRQAGATAGMDGILEVEHDDAVAQLKARHRTLVGGDAGAGAGAVPGGVRVDGVDHGGGAAIAVGDGGVAAVVDGDVGHAVPGAPRAQEHV